MEIPKNPFGFGEDGDLAATTKARLDEHAVRNTSIREVFLSDEQYGAFIRANYGNFEVYLQQAANRAMGAQNLGADIIIPVRVVSDGETFVSDHISVAGIIEQLQLGECTITATKTNGIGRVFRATLRASLIPQSSRRERQFFFGPLRDGRIGFWDTAKQAWASVYPGLIISFTRDETTTSE